MNKCTLFSLLMACATLPATAQNEVDALRYSQSTFGGTARTLGMGGAFGALGGDISSMYINPAGIAVFRKSEFTFTPAFHQYQSTSVFNGTPAFDGKSNFNFSNAGIVFTNRDENKNYGWISTHFGLAYHRVDNYHRAVDAAGVNAKNSLLDTFLENANANGGMTPEELADNYPGSAYLAYYTYLIDTLPGDPYHYYSQIPYAGVMQRRTVESKGSNSETLLSFGANYENRLYVGASIGFAHVRYREIFSYSESDYKDTIPAFTRFEIGQDLQTDGQGINAKVGVIARPHDAIRVGLSYQSPTWFGMNDEYFYSLSAVYDNGFSPDTSLGGLFNYNLKTPSRTTASMAFIIGKAGLVSADYEMVNYGRAKLSSDPYPFDDENGHIASKHTQAANLRVGTEWRLNPFRFRAGYAHYGNPFSNQVNNDGSRESMTLGAGYRGDGYYVDVAYVYTQSSPNIFFYDPTLVDPASQHLRSHIIAVTVGFRY
ncbi:MAG: hypothetical protein H6585_02470 [Flavobacteriales bacterium]|nr:hypothetical protein [Flavobacteriales bacterium]MCB9447193.1 hypothetical protein [Flavobacteriales bacterium]